MADSEPLGDLSERVAQLERRLTALETTSAAFPEADEPEDIFWALEGLKQRLPEPAGAVLMTGAVTVPAGHHAQWQMQVATQELFETDFGARADALSALAHPVRLRVLQRLLTDASTVEEIRAAGDFGTSGQVYHHLRQLVAAGWVTSRGNSRYEVPPARIVPLLVMLLGVDR